MAFASVYLISSFDPVTPWKSSTLLKSRVHHADYSLALRVDWTELVKIGSREPRALAWLLRFQEPEVDSSALVV